MLRRINLQKARNQIARSTTIRDINRQIVLGYVRDRGPISRAQIARETDLHRSTVSLIIDELEADGLIVGSGEAKSTGGRRPMLYGLRVGVPAAIGVDIGPEKTTVGVADLAGTPLATEEFRGAFDSNELSSLIIGGVMRLIERFSITNVDIGVSVPGLVENSSGRIHHVPYFDWKDWDLIERLRLETGCEVIVDNDANAVSLAELWLSPERMGKRNTFLTILVGQGIGTGVVFDGRLYRGEKGAGGEFGHMILGQDAPVECSCGSRECWEAYASEKSMVERFRMTPSGAGTNGSLRADDVISLALEGNRDALDALKETVAYLGDGISNLMVGLSPQVVVLSGKITKAWPIFEEQLSRVAERSSLAGLPPASLVASSLGDSPTLTGAFCLVLARRFGLAI